MSETQKTLMLVVTLASERCMPGGPSYFDLDVDEGKMSARDGASFARRAWERVLSETVTPGTGPKDDAGRLTYTVSEAKAEIDRLVGIGVAVRVAPSAKRALA